MGRDARTDIAKVVGINANGLVETHRLACAQNTNETGQHTPGPDAAAVRFMIAERDGLGFGTESIGTDAGQAHGFDPAYPCHYLMHGAARYGLQCLKNLDQLPATGALVIAPPLKLQGGSGIPLRVLALV